MNGADARSSSVGSRAEPTVATLRLSDERDAPRRARDFVAEHVASAGLGDLADDARTIVTELVTNALLHVGLPAQLGVRLVPPGRVRLEVADHSTAAPVRGVGGAEAMTGRGLGLIEALADDWGVEPARGGKVVWAELSRGAASEASERSADELLEMWGGGDEPAADDAAEPRYTVHLGEVPTDLLLSAKAHVDNLVREFTLAAGGARTGATAAIPTHLGELIDAVVHRFAEPRQAIKRQALAAAREGNDHARLELRLPLSAVEAGEDYLRALDEADDYCRASRLLTLESPPQHRVFRRWYIEELMAQVRQAAAGGQTAPGQSFEQRLLSEIDAAAAAERAAERAARLHVLSAALARALTPEAVAEAVLTEGVSALGATGGGLLLPDSSPSLIVSGTVGYDESTVAGLRTETADAALPAAVALRTGEPVWLESQEERDERFPGLAQFEPTAASLCAVPLTVGERRLGALRFSFSEPRLFDDDVRGFVLALAAQSAQALDRARLYQHQVDVAQRLQRSLLPRRLPDVTGATVTAAHEPPPGDTEVGGDFYDVWQRGADRWVVVIGHAAATGPEAAAVTSLVRHTLRALTLGDADVVSTLEQLDRALVEAAEGEDERHCTVLLGFLTGGPGAFRLDLATGGHPGPVVVRSDGTVEEIRLDGSVLGVFGPAAVDMSTVTLRSGDEVALFTEGVHQAACGQGATFGVPGIAAAATAARRDGTPAAQTIRQAAVAHCGGRLCDELAVLTLRVDGPVTPAPGRGPS